MTTYIYLVRHGESEGNLEGRFMGHSDCGLSQTGRRQAENIAEFFKDTPIDVIVSSDLKRAVNTALPTARAHDLKPETDPAFREIFAGAWEGMSFGEIAENYPMEYACWTGRFDKLQMPGGESSRELSRRVFDALQRTAEKYEGKTVVIVTHATPIQMLRLRIAGLDLDRARSFPLVANASVTKLSFSNGVFSIEYEDRCDHLEEITLLQI